MNKDYFPEKPWACKCGCGYDNIDSLLVNMLNMARYYANTAFVITSACRCTAHNFDEGGKDNSSHLTGLAADIRCLHSHKRYKIMRGLDKAGFKRIGMAKTFIHVDVDDTKPQPCVWVYD